MTAKDIMVSDVPTISQKTPVKEAIKILWGNYGDVTYLNAAPGLIVVNERNELAGILSPLSIINALLDSAREAGRPAIPDAAYYESLCCGLQNRRVEDVMDWHAISVTENALLIDVAELFSTHRFQRIPVVRDKKLVGIIYRSSLLFAMAHCLIDKGTAPPT